jgi:putative OPT family oligopeptide transporter
VTQARELTVRAALTGTLLGGALSLCNIYSGLKIGWSFNMSVTGTLLAFGIWRAFSFAGARPFEKLENNINQAAASGGASISSAGLVSAIPAMTIMTGRTLSYVELAIWLSLVGLVGVLVGVAMRRQLVEIDRLPFAYGVATAETLDRMYDSSAEAMKKVWALLGAGALAAGIKATIHYAHVPNLALPASIAIGARRASAMNFTAAFDPSPLMIAVGALGSLRTGASMLAGASFAWIYLGPLAVERGWAEAGPDDPSASWFTSVVKWLLWPGVGMMVSASLTSVAFSWRAIARTFTGGRVETSPANDLPRAKDTVSVRAFAIALALVLIAVTCAQMILFDISWWAAILAVLLAFVLAAVAGRVSGETSLTPIGAMGKVSQLVFGAFLPANPTANLMCANVTGGAASQCGDLLHDLKTGLMIGASPRRQSIAQAFGVIGGAVCGGAAYLLLLPNPREQIGSAEWPGPAVQTWRAVAEVFAHGWSGLPTYALESLAIGALAGVVLTTLEKLLPPSAARFVPSPAAFGLGFVVQFWYALSLFLGSLIGFALRRRFPAWSEGYLTAIASGVIAGESMMGVGIAIDLALG